MASLGLHFLVFVKTAKCELVILFWSATNYIRVRTEFNFSSFFFSLLPQYWCRAGSDHLGCAMLNHVVKGHQGEATEVRKRYEAPTPLGKQQLRAFLNSL